MLAQVLSASTNAQEVLDAGNWLLDNQSLQGDALTKAAADADFSPNVQALVHFPTVVDMMCRELDWTKQVGAAFTADQGAVLASVQRLRAQATAAGNLKSSPEMTVEQTKQNDKDVIVINNPNPQVVYVPQYNPTTVYTAPPATTTTTTTTTDSGISTSDAVLGGLLLFGAGMAVGSMFDNDRPRQLLLSELGPRRCLLRRASVLPAQHVRLCAWPCRISPDAVLPAAGELPESLQQQLQPQHQHQCEQQQQLHEPVRQEPEPPAVIQRAIARRIAKRSQRLPRPIDL